MNSHRKLKNGNIRSVFVYIIFAALEEGRNPHPKHRRFVYNNSIFHIREVRFLPLKKSLKSNTLLWQSWRSTSNYYYSLFIHLFNCFLSVIWISVIDFCLTKQMVVDPDTQYESLRLQWASQNSCIQRAGRVGRVSDGRVYRLVPRDFFEVTPIVYYKLTTY